MIEDFYFSIIYKELIASVTKYMNALWRSNPMAIPIDLIKSTEPMLILRGARSPVDEKFNSLLAAVTP